jgi:hypothetical protein
MDEPGVSLFDLPHMCDGQQELVVLAGSAVPLLVFSKRLFHRAAKLAIWHT